MTFPGRCLVAFTLAWVLAAVALLTAATSPPSEILVSRQLFQQAHLAIGEAVTLSADAAGVRATRFRVAGVYEPTPDPMKFRIPRLEARLHLPDLIALTADSADPLSAESVTAVNVALANPADAEALAADLSARSVDLVVLPTARPRGGDPFEVLERFHLAIAVVTVVGSTAFLLALMVIRAEERKETVGMLRLIGVSQQSILLGVVAEGVVVAIAGAVFGVLLAALAQYGINAFFQTRYDTALVFVRVTPAIAARSIALALPLGVVAGAVASWILLRRPPAALVGR